MCIREGLLGWNLSREVKKFFWLGKKGDSTDRENGFCNSRGEKAGHRGSEAANYEREGFSETQGNDCRAKFLVPFSLPCQGFQQQWVEHSQSRRGNRRNGSAGERAERYLQPMHALWFLLFMLKMVSTVLWQEDCCCRPLKGGRSLQCLRQTNLELQQPGRKTMPQARGEFT